MDNKTKHGGVFIAIKNEISYEHVQIDLNHQDYTNIKLSIKGNETLICCVYNAPFPSQYQWNVSDFNLLTEKINRKAIELECKHAIITDDVNFSATNWNSMSSKNLYQTELLTKLQTINWMLFYVIIQSPSLIAFTMKILQTKFVLTKTSRIINQSKPF